MPAVAEPVCRVAVSIAGPWRTGNGEKPEGEPIPLLRVGGRPVLPGTAVKGLLRSRAEFILRSVGLAACETAQCAACWTCRVFGSGGGTDSSSESVGVRAVIRFPDAMVRDAPEPTVRTHVAIDRFTGGALAGALYQMEVLEAGNLTVEAEAISAIDAALLGQMRAVFRLVLEDLNDGIIGMGGGTARGYGSVTVDFSSSGLPSVAEARRELAAMMRDGEHASG